MKKYSFTSMIKFIVPSLIGIFLFMIPITTESGITIPVAILSKGLQGILSDFLPYILLVITAITAYRKYHR